MGKASEIWKEIKPKIGEMLAAVNDIETRAEKAQEEAYQRGYCDALEKHCAICEEKHDAEEAYQRGLNDAWDVARKIQDTGGNLNWWIHNTSASEAIEKIRQYEQEKEEIKVGDEVYVETLKGKAVVMKAGKIMCCTFQNGDTFTPHMENCKKTGRHFPEIAEVLQKMRGE